MADPILLAKAAAAVLSDERTRKATGWVLAAILSPLILLIAFFCALGSGTTDHNITAVELCFYGGALPESTPEEYRLCCRIEKVEELSHEDFCRLKITPLANQPFLAEHKDCMFSRDGVIHCLLALGQGSNDGVLIDAEKYDYARLAAYVPGMRDIINAEMDRAADFIIRWGTENTTSGSWCVYFDDLEEHLDLTVREGSGLDAMLRAALKQRPEVSAVDMHDGCIEMEYRSEYCRRLNSTLETKAPELCLKDILPVLAGGGLTLLTHEEADCVVLPENLLKLNAAGREDYAGLLDARVAEIVPGPEGTEVVLTDVAPEELARFNEEYEAFTEAELSMGDMTP